VTGIFSLCQFRIKLCQNEYEDGLSVSLVSPCDKVDNFEFSIIAKHKFRKIVKEMEVVDFCRQIHHQLQVKGNKNHEKY